MKNSSLLLPFFASLVVAFFIFMPFGSVQALEGVAVVNVNTPSVSGSAVTVTGTADSGSKFCGTEGGGGGGTGGLCNCCQPPQGQGGFTGSWQACHISSATYSITGPTTRTGPATITNDTSLPAGCSFDCQSAENPYAPFCDQTLGFSLSESSLPPGDYTVTVTANDCRGPKSASQTFTIPQPLIGQCWASPATIDVEQSLQWRASASGGSGSISYSWTGAVSGSGQPKTVTYTTAGTKNATVLISRGGQSTTETCSATVNAAPNPPVCSPASTTIDAGTSATFNVTGGTSPFSWVANMGSPGTGSGSSFTTSWSEAGIWAVTVTDTSGSSSQCVADVLPFSPLTGTIRVQTVPSSVSATWTLGGGNPFSTITETEPKNFESYLTNTGTYTVSNVQSADPNYSCAVRPPSSQNLGANQTINFYIDCSPIAGPELSCSPAFSSVATGVNTTLTAENSTAAPFDWTGGGSPASEPNGDASFTTKWTSAGDKIVTVTDDDGKSAQCEVSVSAAGSPPTAKLRANGYLGSITIPSGTAATLTWTSTNANECRLYNHPVNPDQWTTVPTSDPVGVSTGPLTSAESYNLACRNSPSYPNFVYSGVTVNVEAAPETGTINVVSNVATTWSISGPQPVSQATPATSASYTVTAPGTYVITPDTPAGHTLLSITPSSSQYLAVDGSVTYTITFDEGGDGEPDGGVSCIPRSQSIDVGGEASLSVGGVARGMYAWSAPGGDPVSGSGSSFETAYGSEGLKAVTVSGDEGSDVCYVSVGEAGNDLPEGTHDANYSESCEVAGWAADPDDRDEDLVVNIYSDDVLVRQIFANMYRSDLEAAGICPEGTCGFRETLAGLVSTGVAHSIRVKALDGQTGEEQALVNTPKSITCQEPPPDFALAKSGNIFASGEKKSESTETTIRVIPIDGFTDTVELSAESDLELEYVFEDDRLDANEYADGTAFSVILEGAVSPGTYPITVSGDGGGFTRTVIVNLVIGGTGTKPPPVFEEF